MIKFRGIPLKDAVGVSGSAFDGTFVYGYYVKNGNGAMIVGDRTDELDDVGLSRWFEDVVPETVGQFTGLTDVNGKDIYEGDIIASKPNELTFEPLKIGVVKRSKIDAGWSYRTATDEYNIWTSGKYRTYEIIGNVHENPELLEAEK